MSKFREIDFEQYFDTWIEYRVQLIELFNQKDASRSEWMQKGITLLAEIIKKADGEAPLNFDDRFAFIEKNKQNYAAFRQLDELFIEMKKKIARLRVMEAKQ